MISTQVPQITSLPSPAMQPPTFTGIHVRTPHDALVMFHAVYLGRLPMVTRRLDSEERRSIHSGCVYVWEERGPNSEATGLGIERWTDGIRWGPSRVRDEFLFYQEKEPDSEGEFATDPRASLSLRRHRFSQGPYRDNLIKQTYSVFVDTPHGKRKWHLIAYYTPDTLSALQTIDSIPALAAISVPPGKYRSARSAKGRPREEASLPHAPTYVEGEPAYIRQPPPSDKDLAPLAYLKTIPPPRRHPLDEKALMALVPQLG